MSILTLFLRKKMFATTRTIVLLCSKFCLTIDYFSFRYPFIGASPDGIFEDFLLEVKCPLVLKDTTPTNISNLTPEQRKDFFLISSETSQDQVELKKTHKYYSQIQFQMYITGYKKSKFIV